MGEAVRLPTTQGGACHVPVPEGRDPDRRKPRIVLDRVKASPDECRWRGGLSPIALHFATGKQQACAAPARRTPYLTGVIS